MLENCIICTDKKLYNIIDNYNVCFNCFHINKNEIQSNSNSNSNLNEQIYFDESLVYLLNEIEDLIKYKGQGKLNILSIDGKNTFILDEIRKKFNVNTVSISEKFNPSYFSSHKCYKYSLKTYCENFNSQENIDDFFDIIILNDTLSFSNDPIDILNKCKVLCNKNTSTEAELQSRQGTQIYSINLHTNVFFSLKYININKNTNHIFNTNSMKTLCKYTNFKLDDCVTSKKNNYNFQMYKLLNKPIFNSIPNKKIIEFLYDEIKINLYSSSTYYDLNNYWKSIQV